MTPPDEPAGEPGPRADAVGHRVQAAVDEAVGSAVDDRVDEAVGSAVDDRVDEAVGSAVDDRVEDVTGDAVAAASRADADATRAEQARDGAEQARQGAVQVGEAAVEAAGRIAPDDPLLDTAARKIEAQATPEQPFGRPGRPMSGRSPFRVAFSAALGVALAYGLVQAVVGVRSVLILLLVSAFLAIGLDPVVRALERRGMPRGGAVGVVLIGVLLIFTGVGLAVIPPVVEQGGQFVASVPGYLADLRGNARVAALDARFGLLARAQEYVSRPERFSQQAVGGVVGVGKVVFSAFFSSLTVLILALYFLSSLPAIKEQAYRLVPRSRRSRVGLLTDEILDRVGGYVGGALVIAALAGTSTFVLLLLLGVQYPVALAVVVTVTDLVPLVGATIGAAVVVLVGFFSSLTAGLACAVFYLLYQQVENYLIYPRVMRRSVDVSPAATIVAVLAGGSLLGVLGALLAIPLAAAVQLVAQEVVVPRQDAR